MFCRVTLTTPSCTMAATAMKLWWAWGTMTCSSPISLPFQSTWSCVALLLSSGRCIIAIFLPFFNFLTGICSAMFVLRSMAKSFQKNYVFSDPASSSAWQILCSWDFSIFNERAITQRKNNLSVQLKVDSFTPLISGVKFQLSDVISHTFFFPHLSRSLYQREPRRKC